jgi:hypothetical protein
MKSSYRLASQRGLAQQGERRVISVLERAIAENDWHIRSPAGAGKPLAAEEKDRSDIDADHHHGDGRNNMPGREAATKTVNPPKRSTSTGPNETTAYETE